MDWIPVADRLPPIGKTVLTCSRMSVTYYVAYISALDGRWHQSFLDMPVPNITHWMPLPELPQGSVVV